MIDLIGSTPLFRHPVRSAVQERESARQFPLDRQFALLAAFGEPRKEPFGLRKKTVRPALRVAVDFFLDREYPSRSAGAWP
jgi:hypothetical protein